MDVADGKPSSTRPPRLGELASCRYSVGHPLAVNIDVGEYVEEPQADKDLHVPINDHEEGAGPNGNVALGHGRMHEEEHTSSSASENGVGVGSEEHKEEESEQQELGATAIDDAS